MHYRPAVYYSYRDDYEIPSQKGETVASCLVSTAARVRAYNTRPSSALLSSSSSPSSIGLYEV